MGFAHASFGTGALVAPLIATQFSRKVHWTFYYFILLGAILLDMVVFTTVFRGKGHEEILKEMGAPEETELQDLTSHTDEGPRPTDRVHHAEVGFFSKHRLTALFALYLFVYVGIEVTIGGGLHFAIDC